jgi:hypothetical protein
MVQQNRNRPYYPDKIGRAACFPKTGSAITPGIRWLSRMIDSLKVSKPQISSWRALLEDLR